MLQRHCLVDLICDLAKIIWIYQDQVWQIYSDPQDPIYGIVWEPILPGGSLKRKNWLKMYDNNICKLNL